MRFWVRVWPETERKGLMNTRRVWRGAITVLIAAWFAVGLRGQGSSGSASKFEVTETTIAETQEAIRSGKVTCRQLVKAYLARIRRYDQSTRLNAIVVINPEALA